MIFVFGSNLAGRHGAGAAKTALNEYGAIYGNPCGIHGNSFAIPTKDRNLHTLPLSEVRHWVNHFVQYAHEHLDTEFLVTRVGCGLAGYKDEDIAPLFAFAPDNCILPIHWEPWMLPKWFYKFHDEGRLL